MYSTRSRESVRSHCALVKVILVPSSGRKSQYRVSGSNLVVALAVAYYHHYFTTSVSRMPSG